MDANQTRYHLLLGADDWASCLELPDDPNAPRPRLGEAWNAPDPDAGHAVSDFFWDKRRNELSLRPELRLFVTPRGDDRPSLANRRAAATDRHGNFYWIDDEETGIRVRSTGCRVETLFWSSKESETSPAPVATPGAFRPVPAPRPPPTPCGLRGLAVTDHHYLVVGVLKPAGLLIFDLHAGGPPVHLVWPNAIDFAPFDLAARPGGGVWILDRDHRRYWGLDRHFNVLRRGSAERPLNTMNPAIDIFRPAEGEPRRSTIMPFPEGIDLRDASPISGGMPVAIEALPDGTVLVLDGGESTTPNVSGISRYRYSERIGPRISLAEIGHILETSNGTEFALVGHDFAFVPAHERDGQTVPAKVFVASVEGNQTFAFEASIETDAWELEPLPEFLPMRRFTGRGLVGFGPRLFYDAADRWVPLVRQDQPRFTPRATLATRVFDGLDPDCVWHRLMLDGCLPHETGVRVWSRAANDRKDLDENRAEWLAEPAPYRRSNGSELPFVARPASPEAGTFELLLQNARGRFLQLRLELSGNRRASPHLRALRVYYPRFSYLKNYLPAVYRENPESASFLDRFLANPEGFLTATEDRIAAVQTLLDPRGAPGEALDWLAGWFGVALDPTWDEERRRLFIRHAMAFFQYRGTLRGLEMALRLVFDEQPDDKLFTEFPARCLCANRYRVVEQFRTRPAPPVSPGPSTDERCSRRHAEPPPWQPGHGVEDLHRRYARFIGKGATTVDGALVTSGTSDDGKSDSSTAAEPRRFRFVPGADDPDRWRQFARGTFGFVPDDNPEERGGWQAWLRQRYEDNVGRLNAVHSPAVTEFAAVQLPPDMPLTEMARADWRDYMAAPPPATAAGARRRRWQAFLTRRYVRIEGLNAAWNTRWDAFASVPLPAELPADDELLRDWFDFESIVMPTARAAHQFSVLLPVTRIERTDTENRQRTLRLARRVIDLEKPVHTTADVNFYWALFRAGEARLGLDSLLVADTRALVLTPMILNEGFLASSYLAR